MNETTEDNAQGGGEIAASTPLPSLVCEKSLQLLRSPVRLLGDGRIYEKEVIETHLMDHDTSPTTGDILSSKELVDEKELKTVCQRMFHLADMPPSEAMADTLRDEINKSLQNVIHENNAFIKEHATLLALSNAEKNPGDEEDASTPSNKFMDEQDKNTIEKSHSLEKLQSEEKDLLTKIDSVRQARITLLKRRKDIVRLENRILEYELSFDRAMNQLMMKAKHKEEDEISILQTLSAKKKRLKILSAVNVCNVAFFLWTDGAFGTINTFRLGRTPSTLVDWNEINAAWGQTALLLATIAHKLGFTFTKYRIIPMGSNSKIAKAGQERTSYDLSHHGGRWLSGGRFNTAMSAFLECVSELCNHATKQDRSFLLPHTIKGSKVDGYSIKLHGNSSVDWTRALKYMLSNLKWLLAWSVRGY